MSYWRDKAVCRYYDPEIMFPTGGPETPARAELAAVAMSLCSVCPVTRQCLELAMEIGATDGVFGGIDLGDFLPSRRGAQARRDVLRAAVGHTEEVAV